VSAYLSVSYGVAWRVLHKIWKNPALLAPSLIFPLFFFTAFAGGLSGIEKVPGFDFPAGYTAFQFVFVLLQSAAIPKPVNTPPKAADWSRTKTNWNAV